VHNVALLDRLGRAVAGLLVLTQLFVDLRAFAQ
jgi:hypothetical protein